MIQNYIRKNISLFSLSLFLVLFLIIVSIKPSLIYNKDGSFKNFGIGYKNKTIFPIWLVVILTAIFSYSIVLFIVIVPKLQF